MSKNILIRFIPTIIILLFSVFIGFADNSSCSGNYTYEEDNAFYLEKYIIDIDARSDRYVYVREEMQVEFTLPRAAIIRDLPINNGLVIRDIKVEDRDYKVTSSSGFLSVDMDASNFIKSTTPRTYTLTYTMVTPEIKGAYDSIALNVVGFGWPTYINNAEVTLKLPAAPVSSSYYVGKAGTTGGEIRLNKTVNGNIINLKTTGRLAAFEGITAGYDLPAGTMHTVTDYSSKTTIILISTVVLFLITLFLFIKIGKDKQIYPVVNFYPPLGLTPAQMGYLIDGNCSSSDITAMIYYWASKGYLRIIENEEKTIILKRVNPLPVNAASYEKTIFNALFNKRETVDIDCLKETFYTNIETAKREITAQYSDKLFNKGSRLAAFIAAMLSAVFLAIVMAVKGGMISDKFSNGFLFIPFIPAVILFITGMLILRYEPKFYEHKTVIQILYFLLVAAATFIVSTVLNSLMFTLLEKIISCTAFGICLYISPFIQCRTDEYNKILNDVLGFKNFIKTAEKTRLELLLKENPEYYYDILPYAQVLGVTEIWMDKFKDLTLQPPRWYGGYGIFSMYLFNRAFLHSYSTITDTVNSRPASSGRSGGGFGGGGFGGGFGGGGFGGGGGHSR